MRHPTTLHSGDVTWPAIRILLFSQDDAFRFLVRQTFRKLKVREVLSTSVSADATPMMAQGPDIGLIDLDGDLVAASAFLERVRAAAAEMPVLMVARSGEMAGIDDARRMGIEGVAPKLVSGHELVHRVAETLKNPNRLPVPAAKERTGTALPPLRPAAAPLGTVSESTFVPAPRHAPSGAAPSTAFQLKPKARNDATRRREQEAKADWQTELAQIGHVGRTGGDIAGLDVAAIVAAHLAWLTGKGATGKRATFEGMDLAGGDLSRAVLANATFRAADLSDARMAESRLDGADFRHAKLGAADLAGANLGVAQLRHADLRLANLQGATLRGADLSGARLTGAKLAGADFGGAMLVGTDLRDADLALVDNLTQDQIDKAVCDVKTTFPPGLLRRPAPLAAEDAAII